MKKLSVIVINFLLIFTLAITASGCNNSNNPNGETEGMDKLVKNFWENDTMYDETILLTASTDEAGNIVNMPEAKLLFNASEIIEVKQYFHMNNSGVVYFTQGTDFEYSEGKIIAKGNLTEDINGINSAIDTNMPYVTDKQISGEAAFPNLGASTAIPSTDAGLYLPFSESYQIVQMQLSVTYKYNHNDWQGTIPLYYGNSVLQKTVSKLKNKENIDLFFFGDSISTGANSSSILKITPNLATFPELVATNLAKNYGGKVILTNKSVGGWTTVNAISASASGWLNGELINQAGISGLLDNELANYSPDIAVIGFGMNDATAGISINNYYTNTKKIIDELKSRNESCEIILLGTMLANPKALNQSKNQISYYVALTQLVSEYSDVCAINIGQMHQDLLNAGKKFIDMSSNNVNHPNDFMARIYAMNILSALID